MAARNKPVKQPIPNLPTARGPGRPSKLTKATITLLVNALKSGAPHNDAAQYAGIEVSTFYRWMQAGETDAEAGTPSEFCDFYNAVKKAQSAGKIECLKGIKTAGKRGNWQALAWILERRYPDEFGRQRIDVTSNGKTLGSAAAALDGLTDAEQRRILEAALNGVKAET